MKKITSLGTVAALSFATLAGGIVAANAAGTGTLTSLAFQSNAATASGTEAQAVTRIINGDAVTGSAIVDGCVIDYKDGVETARNDIAAVSWDSATQSASAFGFTNTTATTITYMTEVYNVACDSITGEDTPVVGTYDVLPNASYSFDGSKSYTAGVDVGTDPVAFTENGSFNFDNGGTIALAEGASMPAGLSDNTGFDVVGNVPTLNVTGLPTATAGSYPVDFVISDTYGNSATATLTINITAAPVTPSVSASPNTITGVIGTDMTDVITLSTPGDWNFTAAPTVDVTGLPAGVSHTVNWTGNTPTGITLSGQPTSTGSSSATITVTDTASSTAFTSVSWSVSSAPVPATLAVNPSVLNGTVGTAVNSVFTLTLGGDWNFSTGSTVTVTGLPAGLSETVQKTGNTPNSVTISGIPSAVEADNITISVSDNFGNTQNVPVAFDIQAAPLVPSFDVVGDVNFMQDIESTVTITFENDVNFDWTNGGTVSVVGLPAGLTATVIGEATAGTIPSVTISGTATTVGDFNISYILSDYATPTANEAQVDAVATIIAGATSSSLVLNTPVGSPVASAPVNYAGSGLKVGTEWSLTFASTPVVLVSGTVATGGNIGGSIQMPANVTAGWHTLTLAGTAWDGSAYSKVVYVEVDASGNLVQTTDTKPADVTPAADALAKTGIAVTGFVAAMIAMLAAGVAFMFGARRRTEANN